MSSELSLLIPEFRSKVEEVINLCKKQGINLEPITTLITPVEQAKLWKQGRSAADAELRTLALENEGAKYLADCLRKAIPTETALATNDLPGFSWFQWGEAVSCVWIDDMNKLNWNPFAIGRSRFNGYQLYRQEAKNLGIVLDETKTMKSWSKVYFRSQTPKELYSVKEIDTEMKKRFAR